LVLCLDSSDNGRRFDENESGAGVPDSNGRSLKENDRSVRKSVMLARHGVNRADLHTMRSHTEWKLK
jgi:hypothetical protein